MASEVSPQKHIGGNVQALGVVMLIAAVIWWYISFSGTASEPDQIFTERAKCLYSTAHECTFLSGMAELLDPRLKKGYDPKLLWVGATVTAIGTFVSNANHSDNSN